MLKAIILVISLSLQAFPKSAELEAFDSEEAATFSARVARINSGAELVRLKIDFANGKYLRDGDKVEFWNASHPGKRCLSYVKGRSSEYLLVKVPMYKDLRLKGPFNSGKLFASVFKGP